MALFFVTRRQLSRATAAYSLALSIKMGALLYLPGLVLLLLMNCGPRGTVKHLAVILELQMLLAGPFLLRHPRTYLQGAFDFGRQFLWTWTVNWRFLSPDIFQDRRFQSTLLVLHGTTLFIFAWSRWSRPARRGLASVAALCLRSIVTWPKDVLQGQSPGEKLIPNDARLLADYALTTMLSSNLIGILFARSLHYQFYSWFAWGMPYLCFIATLDSDGMATISNVPERGRQSRITKMMLLQHWLSVVALAAPRVIPLCILEACWLTFPSTRASSGLHCMVCAIILIWVWASSATRPTLVLEPTRSRLNTDLRLATRKRPRK
ncbi:dolichyl-P-Man:Man(5)GlcNAc(2)-PP-dolichol alpha-1,3-mannosyltransferase [Savitreella phatthalungensis]